MLISLFGGAQLSSVADVVNRARLSFDAGLDGVWFPQTPGIDALCALAVAAHEVPQVRLGTAVVPIQGRHPYPLAQAALTVADAAGPDRFTLGIGVTHQFVSEGVYGVPYRGVVERFAEHLVALRSLLGSTRTSDIAGEHVFARGTIALDTSPPGLVVAALGPRMLELAGAHSDGTVTWMTGARVLRDRVVPAVQRAASHAGRPSPRVIVGLPVCVTDDVDGARDVLASAMAPAAGLPSYRRMLQAEGVQHPVEIALVGSDVDVGRGLDELAAAGATELVANLIGPADTDEHTVEVLAARSTGATAMS